MFAYEQGFGYGSKSKIANLQSVWIGMRVKREDLGVYCGRRK